MVTRQTYYADHVSCNFGVPGRIHFSLSDADWSELQQRAKSFTIPDYENHVRDAIREHGRSIGPDPMILTHPSCPYCAHRLEFFGQPNNEPFIGYYAFAGECNSCGWWFCFSGNALTPEGTFSQEDYFEGVLRTFDISAAEVPTGLLSGYLTKHLEDVSKIHPRKFEELCQALFREHFNCEVRLGGCTNDGGIDLYVVESNAPFVVQLKRRSNDRSESVAAIREFVGALILNGETDGLFVTTAKKYSPAAKAVTANPRLRAHGIKLELGDYTFLERMFAARDQLQKPWKSIPGVRAPAIEINRQQVGYRFPW